MSMSIIPRCFCRRCRAWALVWGWAASSNWRTRRNIRIQRALRATAKMAEKHSPAENPTAAEHYYDYEARFIKQKREQERINILPRVIKPAMFAKGEFALGDPRVFSRYTAAPLSVLTCSFVELGAGGETAPRRMIPSIVAYVVAGSGACFQDGAKVEFAAGDVVLIPPYTTYHFSADSKVGLRAWLPQLRLWHGQGLLWRDSLGARKSDDEKEPV